VNQFVKTTGKNGGILHHDNAPAHTSHLVQQFLAKHDTAQLQLPPYSPDLAPCDFFLFPTLKKVLKGHRFAVTEDIKQNSTKTLLDIPNEEFAKCFQQWQKRWAKCVAAEGNCVEDN
jgi:transposase